MPIPHRADLDELAWRLRQEGLLYRQIASRLGCTREFARRRVQRYERLQRETAAGQTFNDATAKDRQ